MKSIIDWQIPIIAEETETVVTRSGFQEHVLATAVSHHAQVNCHYRNEIPRHREEDTDRGHPGQQPERVRPAIIAR